MRTRLFSSIVCAALAGGALGAGAESAPGQEICVETAKPGCFATIPDALAAAHDGDRIRIGRGTFAGGFTIDASVTITGAGADQTTISGGGPVVTVGVRGADTEPTVTITGVTITGGDNGAPGSADTVFATGGGVFVSGGGSGGAVVTIRDSVVTGNRAAPTDSTPTGPPCPGGPCPFAQGEGGGIANGGTLTLEHVTVSNNVAGSDVASDADGGGISNLFFATLTIRNSTISGNLARVSAPNGRFADAGGVRSRFGSLLTIDNSSIDGNRVEAPLAEPDAVEINAVAGGIHLGNEMAATIRNTTIDGNSVDSSNALGTAIGCAGGLAQNEGATLDLRGGSVSGNSVNATTVTSTPSPADTFACSGGMDLSGEADVRNTRFVGNTLSATTSTGGTLATGGAISTISDSDVTIRNSRFAENGVTVGSSAGAATGLGGAIANTGPLTLRNTTVTDNTVAVSGPNAVAQGSGIFNGAVPGLDIPRQLTLLDSVVARNGLTGPAGATLQGGGLFTDSPVTTTHTQLAQNAPDDCFGC